MTVEEIALVNRILALMEGENVAKGGKPAQIAEPAKAVPIDPPRCVDMLVIPEGEMNGMSVIQQLERDLFAFAMRKFNGKKSHIAKWLGIGRSTLYYKSKGHKRKAA